MNLIGNTALVTGASRGIGRGIALKLAEHGVKHVGVHYHKNETAARETAARLAERGARALLVQADVADVADIERMFERIGAELGRLDVFVSNARPDVEHFYQPLFDIPLANWQKAFDSQARAFLIGTRAAATLMDKGGRVVAVTHAPGARTGTWQPWAAMGSAKAAMESLVRYFAVALAGRGITVNAVSPGATQDAVFDTLPPAVIAKMKAWAEAGWVPMGRLTTPADVGDAVALLATPEAGFITGQTIYVDGGASLAMADLPLDIQKAA